MKKQRPALLNEILESAKKQKSAASPLVALFDLDSTLFDVSPRIAEIFRSFAALPEIKRVYPAESRALSEVTPHTSDFGVRRTLERIHFKPPDEDFIKNLVAYWKKLFFGNDFLKFDTPYPGAQSYVSELHDCGAKIMYLTGRDIPRMLKGTVESLRQWNFPLDPGATNLILKPTKEESDSEFKKHFFMKMKKRPGEVWFFENEPTNIELVLTHTPNVKIVFVDTVHAEKTPPPGAHVPRIASFEI